MIAILIIGLVLGANAFPTEISQSQMSNKKQIGLQIGKISEVGHDEMISKPVSFLIFGQEFKVRIGFKFDSDAMDAKLKFRFHSNQTEGNDYDIKFKGMLHFRVEGQDHSNFTYFASMTNIKPVTAWTTTLTRRTILKEVTPYEDKLYMLLDFQY